MTDGGVTAQVMHLEVAPARNVLAVAEFGETGEVAPVRGDGVLGEPPLQRQVRQEALGLLPLRFVHVGGASATISRG